MHISIKSLAIVGLLCACTPVEDLRDDALQARLSDQTLLFVNPDEADETMTMVLRADGTGTITESRDAGERIATDKVFWRAVGDNLCLRADGPSQLSSSGREECAATTISGNQITVSTGSDPFSGTIQPL